MCLNMAPNSGTFFWPLNRIPKFYMRIDATAASSAAGLQPLLATLACSLLLACVPSQPEGFDFKIAVVEDGMIRVEFDELGYAGPSPASAQLILTERGLPLVFELDDGGDGRFGPGDSLNFPGRHLQGAHSWFDPWSDENIYRLRLSKEQPHSPTQAANQTGGTLLSPANTPGAGPGKKLLTRHFEREEIRVALPESEEAPREAWYWQRLSHLDRRPFELTLPAGRLPVGIRVALSGLSADQAAVAAAMLQHRVELLLNGHVIGSQDWNGQAGTEIVADAEALTSALEQFDGSASKLELRVPRRQVPGQTTPLIDVVLLNWIEIDYQPIAGAKEELSYPGPDGERHYLIDTGIQQPRWIKPYREAGLRSDTETADYLMIAHASLLEALMPLADFHRQRGLKVVVVDVEHIYNEFNDGIVSPFAIRDFIRHSSENRDAPATRHVLLVGDASWDVRGADASRKLLPSMLVQAGDELAASDNGFVTVHGDDDLPDLAIGRIPAADAAELTAVVQKLLVYAQSDVAEPWHQQAALVADASESFQDISDQLAAGLASHGLTVNRVFPGTVSDKALQDQQALLQAFDSGQLLVHFLGHGGRFVWRTGPLDYKNASDLFTVADLERLQNGHRLPLVLSMTCSSGPFDHPLASSIAEAFLLLPGNGAMGVLAASWRVPASKSFSKLLLGELLQPGHSIGEAILKAKQKESNLALVESYNFFGDPALQLKLPTAGSQQ